MTIPRRLAPAALLAASLVLAACRRDDVVVRHFQPYPLPAVAAPAAPPVPDAPRVRLDPAVGAEHLREAMVWQVDGVEYGFRDDRRWTATPAHYVDRALAHELFERRGLTRTTGRDGAIVTTSLLAFEEVRAPGHAARVALAIAVTGTDGTVRERTVEAEVPIAADAPEAFARAMGEALGRAAAAAGEFVAATVAPHASRSTSGTGSSSDSRTVRR